MLTVLFAPYVQLGSFVFRIELLLTPVLVVFVILVHNRGRFVWPAVVTAYTLWCILVGFVTLLHSGDTEATGVPWTGLYGVLRPSLIVVLFASISGVTNDLTKLARALVYSCIPLGLLAVVQALGISAPTALTVAGYSSPTRTPIGVLISQLGIIARGVSVFESPPYAATYFLLALSTGLWLLIGHSGGRRNVTLTLAGMGMALLGGVFTLSATFVGGLVVVMLQFLWLARRRAHITIALGIVLLGMTLAAVSYVVSQGGILSGTLAYQFNRLSTLSVFASRYGGGAGIESPALQSIVDHPFLGVGISLREGVFVGDSIFVMIPYWGGVMGAGLFGYVIYQSLHSTRRQLVGHSLVVLWVVVLLAAGLGSGSFLTPRVHDWWWAIVGIASRGTGPRTDGRGDELASAVPIEHPSPTD